MLPAVRTFSLIWLFSLVTTRVHTFDQIPAPHYNLHGARKE